MQQIFTAGTRSFTDFFYHIADFHFICAAGYLTFNPYYNQNTMYDNYINSTAIFAEVKKNILSKDFKFGQLTNVFGRTTVDFSHADINGAVVLDSTQLFGEVRIKVPADWHVAPEMTNILAAVEDKRRTPMISINYNKVLILRGVGIFATIKIVDCF